MKMIRVTSRTSTSAVMFIVVFGSKPKARRLL